MVLTVCALNWGCNRHTSSNRLLIMSLMSPWPMWQHDPGHSGRSSYMGPDNPVLSREIDLCCHGLFGSPVVDGTDRVFIGSIRSIEYSSVCDAFDDPVWGASGLLYGIHKNGTEIDGFPFDSQRGSVMAAAIEDAPLVLNDGSLVFGKDDGWMYRLRSDGTVLWQSPADDPYNPLEPVDDNEQMIPSPVPGLDNTIVFLSHFADVYGPGPVADAAERACPGNGVFKTEGTPWYSKLYALDAGDGERRWVFDPGTDPASGGQPMVGWGAPALLPDGTYIITVMHTEQLPSDNYVPTSGRVFAIGQDGQREWVFPSGPDPLDYSLWTSPVVSPAGAVYIGASDYTYASTAKILALSEDGELLWSFEVDENTVVSSPALRSDGTIIVATQNRHLSDPDMRYGRVYALDDKGDHAEELWRYPDTGTVPRGFYSSPLVDASGRVYIANEPFPFAQGEAGLLLSLETDGSLLFSRSLDGYVHGNLALGAHGELYVPLHDPPRLLVFADQ